jgi:uncharacterized protein YkwD
VAIASLVLVPAPGSAAETADRERSAEEALFDLHNQARTDPAAFGHGGQPAQGRLLWADDLAETARDWSATMARNGRMSHRPDLRSQVCCGFELRENVGYAPPLDRRDAHLVAANRLMEAWMDSDGHRRAVLRGELTQVGIGVALGDDGSLWATAVFRAPTADAPTGTPTYAGGDATALGTWDGRQPAVRDVGAACPASLGPSPFDDVLSAEADRAVGCLAWWGVTDGVAARSYEPFATVRRDQLATFVARAIERSGGRLPDPGAGRFLDVDPTSSHAVAIQRLAAAGIVGGYGDGTFRPQQPVTRAQMAKYLVEAFAHRTGRPPGSPDQPWFVDTTSSALRGEIDAAADAGWAAGAGDGRYRPMDGVRRHEMARFLTRWLSHLVEDGHASLPRHP